MKTIDVWLKIFCFQLREVLFEFREFLEYFCRRKMFNPDHILPPEMRIKSVDNHLYEIGLWIKTNGGPHKKLAHKPVVGFSALLFELIRCLIFATISTHESKYDIYFGNFGALTGINEYYVFLAVNYILNALAAKVIYYWNFKEGIEPTFLRIFQMMSGLVPPKAVGLTDKKEILWLIKRTKLVMKIAKFNSTWVGPPTAFGLAFFGYLRNGCSLSQVIIFGIPNSFLFTLMGICIFDTMMYQLIHFYILCVYLKMKIQSINANLLEKKSLSIGYIVSKLKAMNSLYLEINEYNTTFWSKYLLLLWLTMSSLTSIELIIVVFSNMPLLYRVIAFYAMVTYCFLFIFVVFTASSVNYQSNKSYKILNHLFVSNFINKQTPTLSTVLITTKLKVICF